MKKNFITALLLSLLVACERDSGETPDIDLTANELTFELVSRNGLEGRVAVRGKVRNIGDHFISEPGQQRAVLYRKIQGGETRLETKVDFHLLEKDETIDVHTIISWDASIEFPPDFILTLEYDPDLLMDGNVHNDDKNSSNNSVTKSGTEIHALFN